MRKLAQSVFGYINKHELLRAGDRVGVAVSGGADSVALLCLMLELRDELGIVLSVVHLNHKLRGAESDADEQFVGDLAAAHDLEITSETHDVKAYAAQTKLSLEAAAREVRYEFFRCVLQSHVCRIATAHTLDDQAETVLLKLARGAGTRGLAGIYPKVVVRRSSLVVGEEAFSIQHLAFRKTATSSQVSALSENGGKGIEVNKNTIVRPLLGALRAQLREYLTEIGQSWREDATNQDLRHTRNRIRHQVLPVVSKEINPSFCNVLSETAEIARAEEEYWTAEMHRRLPQIWHSYERGGNMNCPALHDFPLALKRRLVRAAAESLGISLEFQHVEEILGLHKEGDCAVLPSSWVANLRADKIEFSHLPKDVADYEYELPIPGKITVPEAGIEVEALLCSGEDENQKYSPEHLVGLAFVLRGLVVRNWRAGERFWPAHSKEPKKIKELLQDRHITGDRKKLWPVVASGGEIVWLRGLGVRRDFQANDGRGILIQETKRENT